MNEGWGSMGDPITDEQAAPESAIADTAPPAPSFADQLSVLLDKLASNQTITGTTAAIIKAAAGQG